jgi:hypothetical protein
MRTILAETNKTTKITPKSSHFPLKSILFAILKRVDNFIDLNMSYFCNISQRMLSCYITSKIHLKLPCFAKDLKDL